MSFLDAIKAKLVDDRKTILKAWSTWSAGAGALLMTIATLAPQAWTALPQDMRELVPWAPQIALALFAVTLFAKFIKQKKPDGQ